MGVVKFIVRRVAWGACTVLAVSMLVFLLTHALGDPARAVLGRDAQQPALLDAKRLELGLDRPLVSQYVDWLGGLLSGDAGRSYSTGRPIGEEMGGRIQNSLVLMSCGLALAIPSSLLLGVHVAVRRDRALDTGANGAALVLAGIPEFVLATVLVVLFSTTVIEILPAVSEVRGGTRPWDDLDGLILPSVTLALIAVPYLVRSVRAGMIEVLDSDYIRVARLNGIPKRAVLWRHALPNAIGPTLQVVALSVGYMAGGVVVVEQVFNYPGIGSALVDAITAHNVPVVQFIAVFVATLQVVCTTLADIATVLVTPRLRTALT